MTGIIHIEGLTKRYGKRTAIDDLNLSIEAGEIFGFVGPNGAGKTSTIRIAAGLLQPTQGEVYIQGFSVSENLRQVRAAIGYMPDYFGIYPDLRVWEYLDFFSACYNIPENDRPALISGLLELVDLSHRQDDSVDRLSRGMKQRLSLARSLIHDPQVLILDEPAAGLDPRARVEIRELMIELAKMGKTIFFSTHILSDVAEICTRVGIIEAGKLVACDTLEALHLQTLTYRRIEVTILNGIEMAHDLLAALPEVIDIQAFPAENDKARDRMVVDFSGDDLAMSKMLAKLVHADIQVLQFTEDQRDLEEVFLRTTKGLVT